MARGVFDYVIALPAPVPQSQVSGVSRQANTDEAQVMQPLYSQGDCFTISASSAVLDASRLNPLLSAMSITQHIQKIHSHPRSGTP